MKKVLIIGPAPQNIGGISIHIRRLVTLLQDDYAFDFVDEWHTRIPGVFNLRSGNVFRYLSKVIQADVIHIQSGIWSLRAFHIVVCKLLLRKQTIVTIHRDPNIEPHTGVTKWLLSKCDSAILVNKEGYDAMRKEGKCQYVLLPAFLPPIIEEEPQIPAEIERWVYDARQQEGSYVMCSNAWKLVTYNEQDLYGIDLCIEAMHHLNDSKFFLVFVVASNPSEQERIASYKKTIKTYGLEKQILLWEQPTSFVRLLQKCDLVLRTTNTDGDAISIREALYYGIPVLASDIVRRPKGVCLFKNRDAIDLAERIKDMRNNNSKVDLAGQIDYRKLFCSIYD